MLLLKYLHSTSRSNCLFVCEGGSTPLLKWFECSNHVPGPQISYVLWTYCPVTMVTVLESPVWPSDCVYACARACLSLQKKCSVPVERGCLEYYFAGFYCSVLRFREAFFLCVSPLIPPLKATFCFSKLLHIKSGPNSLRFLSRPHSFWSTVS